MQRNQAVFEKYRPFAEVTRTILFMPYPLNDTNLILVRLSEIDITRTSLSPGRLKSFKR